MRNKGKGKRMKDKLTIDDIARELGVSKSTVSRALSGNGRIGKETVRKIKEYVASRSYEPNSIAKSLAVARTYNIGIVFPGDANLSGTPFFHNCLLGITEEAASYEYNVIVITAKDDNIDMLKQLIERKKVDGIILTRNVINDLSIQYLQEVHFPFVLIGSSEEDNVIQIDSNHRESSEKLTFLLLAEGVRRIAFFTGDKRHIVNRYRNEGFYNALEKRKMQVDPDWVYDNCDSQSYIDKAMNSLLEKKVECILCSDDVICERVLVKLMAEGYSIPGDIKVASLYDSIHIAGHNPPITAVEVDSKQLGNVAVRRLLQTLDGKGGTLKEMVDYEIHIRKSTT